MRLFIEFRSSGHKVWKRIPYVLCKRSHCRYESAYCTVWTPAPREIAVGFISVPLVSVCIASMVHGKHAYGCVSGYALCARVQRLQPCVNNSRDHSAITRLFMFPLAETRTCGSHTPSKYGWKNLGPGQIGKFGEWKRNWTKKTISNAIPMQMHVCRLRWQRRFHVYTHRRPNDLSRILIGSDDEHLFLGMARIMQRQRLTCMAHRICILIFV